MERCLFSRLGPQTLSSCGGAGGVGWLGGLGGGSWCWLVGWVFLGDSMSLVLVLWLWKIEKF